jgi:hypothetical protein
VVTAAALIWWPALLAVAVILIVTRPPGRTVPSRQWKSPPRRQLPWEDLIESTSSGRREVSVTRTWAAASPGPWFITVIV